MDGASQPVLEHWKPIPGSIADEAGDGPGTTI